MAKIRVIRVLVYEGEEAEVKQHLNRCFVNPNHHFEPADHGGRGPRIEEKERYEDVHFRLMNDPSTKSIPLDQIPSKATGRPE